MRPLALEPRLLRSTVRDLESAGDEVAATTGRVAAPEQPYPWRGLVERGVASLLRDALELAEACGRLADRLEDSLRDFEELDGHVAGAASVRR